MAKASAKTEALKGYDIPQVTIETAARYLIAFSPSRTTVFLHGEPGCGKTATPPQVCQALGWDLCMFPPASMLESPDIRGLLYPNQKSGRTVCYPPDFLPEKDFCGLVVYDEMDKADRGVMSAQAQMIHDRKIGKDYFLPEDAVNIVMANRKNDRAGGNPMPTPLLNRCCHLEVVVNADVWDKWAFYGNAAFQYEKVRRDRPGVIAQKIKSMPIHPVVRGYVKFQSNDLSQFDPRSGAVAWPSPRTWEILSNLYHAADMFSVDEDLVRLASLATVGCGVGTKVNAFRDTYGKLPSIEDILRNPDKIKLPDRDEAGVMFAICTMVVSNIQKLGNNLPDIHRLVRYALRMPRNFAVLVAQDAIKVNKKSMSSPEARDWVVKNEGAIDPKDVEKIIFGDIK